MPYNPDGNGRSGRSVALPDENRPSWRPQDERTSQRARHTMSEEDERYWEDRERRDWDRWERERDDYRHGRRDPAYPGSFEERFRERGYTPRGYEPERLGTPRGYGYYDGDRPNLGTGGGMHREHTGYSAHEGRLSGHRGKGPLSYQRSDERVREAVCEALTEDDRIDATNIDVSVKSGEVVLSGSVDERQMKRLAEDCIENISGVRDVQNQIRVVGDKRTDDRSRHRG
jgi:hypothetical protein